MAVPAAVVSALTAAGFAYVLFVMIWVGTSIYVEAALVPRLRRFKTTGQVLTFLPLFRKTSTFKGISGVLVLVSGAAFLVLKYQPVGKILTGSPGPLSVLALALVLVAEANGFLFLRPVAKKLRAVAWLTDTAAPLPEMVRPLTRKMIQGSTLNTMLVVVVLALLIMAATGGI
jgi:hypothetical protein